VVTNPSDCKKVRRDPGTEDIFMVSLWRQILSMVKGEGLLTLRVAQVLQLPE
jgi:hypothetical protein